MQLAGCNVRADYLGPQGGPTREQGNWAEVSTQPSNTLVVADPAEACTRLQNAGEMRGKIVVVLRGTCTFVSKVQAVEVGKGSGHGSAWMSRRQT